MSYRINIHILGELIHHTRNLFNWGQKAKKKYHLRNAGQNEILSDELAGMKRVMLKLETHHAIQELSIQRSGATYDDIILMCINSYHREQVNNFNGNDQLESIVSDNGSEEET